MFLRKLKATVVALGIAGLLVCGLLSTALSGAPRSALAQQPAGAKKDRPVDKAAPAQAPGRLKVRMTLGGHGMLHVLDVCQTAQESGIDQVRH